MRVAYTQHFEVSNLDADGNERRLTASDLRELKTMIDSFQDRPFEFVRMMYSREIQREDSTIEVVIDA